MRQSAPISRPVHKAMTWLLDDVMANGVAHAGDWWRHVDEVRKEAAGLLGTEPRKVAFAKNTSEGLNFAANGIDWRPGDEVVTGAMEFPANRYPWLNLADRGVVTRLVEGENGALPAELLIAAMNERTRVLAVSAVQYVSGYRVDLVALGKACRERDVLFVVDAIQIVGALPFAPDSLGIDVVAADSHKWMLGPEGIGIAWFSDRALERLRVAEVGWASVAEPLRYEEQTLTLHPHARRFECGTNQTVSHYGLGAACKLLNEIGMEVIGMRVITLAERIRARVLERGWRIYGSDAPACASGIVSFDPGGADPAAIFTALYRHGVQASARGGYIRFSPHISIRRRRKSTARSPSSTKFS